MQPCRKDTPPHDSVHLATCHTGAAADTTDLSSQQLPTMPAHCFCVLAGLGCWSTDTCIRHTKEQVAAHNNNSNNNAP
jgi:hypothetical protein